MEVQSQFRQSRKKLIFSSTFSVCIWLKPFYKLFGEDFLFPAQKNSPR